MQFRRLFMAAALAIWPSIAAAQAPGTATLVITVADPSGAVLPDATVTIAGAEDATRRATHPPAKTDPNGVATLTGLTPGRYSVEAAFPGFETQQLPDLRLRAGNNKQLVLLPIQKMEASVTVGQGTQEAAADPRGRTFGTTLTREQLEVLSDDPRELQQQLQDMAGPGAVIRVDSFEGGALPSKAQIRSIRISRDQFAAEYHAAGGVGIDIITQPGIGPVRYFMNVRGRSDALSGTSPFIDTRGPEQNVNYGFGLGGTLIKDKSSFNMNVFGIDSYDTPNLNVALGTGGRSEALRLRTERDLLFINGQVDYALTLDQTLRIGYNGNLGLNDNIGVGGYDEEERAFSVRNRMHTLRLQQLGPLGRRAFLRTRLQFVAMDTERQSAVEAVTIRVDDAFTRGGAQVSGGPHSRALNLAADLDYVRGPHSIRTGFSLDTARFHSDDTSNYLGTYTFENLDAFLENRPRSFTRRLGDPDIRYSNILGGVYVQDDIRVRRNLTLSPGLRYEAQTHVGDYANVAPRFGVTWAPFASGATSLRGSWGIFHDWLPTGTYEQTLRVDGFRQQELNILDPSFPASLDAGIVPPINRYFLGSDFASPRVIRLSAGVDQTIMKVTRLAFTYSYIRGEELARGLNLNPPADGIRPDPTFANVVEVVSDASSRQHQLVVDANVNPGAMMPASSRARRVNWKRSTVFANYTLARLRDNTDGAFGLPASGVLAAEWGPANNDIRHRMFAAYNNQIIRNVLMSLMMNVTSGGAYTLRTGRDDNGDLVFNDRPAGVGRNTLRMPVQWNVNAQLGYAFAFGRRANPLPPGIGVFGGGNAAVVRTVDEGDARYRLSVFVFAQNLTNHPNYLGYSGVLTSPFFGRATSVNGMRKIDVGLNLNF